MLKLILCIIIVAACGGLGILKALNFASRLEDLEDLQGMIKVLETEINYKRDPLPSAFARISAYKDNRAMDLLWECSQALKASADFNGCWEGAVERIYGPSSLTEEDRMILKDMGMQLGKSDLSGQTSMFSLANLKLDAQIKAAAEEKKTKGKMYKSLGFSIGAVIAIILI